MLDLHHPGEHSDWVGVYDQADQVYDLAAHADPGVGVRVTADPAAHDRRSHPGLLEEVGRGFGQIRHWQEAPAD